MPRSSCCAVLDLPSNASQVEPPCSAAHRTQFGRRTYDRDFVLKQCDLDAKRRAVNEDDALLALAERTLRSELFFFVGVFEQYNASLALLARKLGLPTVPDSITPGFVMNHRSNVPGGFVESLHDSTLRALQQMNRLDMPLYRGALRRFRAESSGIVTES